MGDRTHIRASLEKTGLLFGRRQEGPAAKVVSKSTPEPPQTEIPMNFSAPGNSTVLQRSQAEGSGTFNGTSTVLQRRQFQRYFTGNSTVGVAPISSS
eukprot:5784464-Pyramimonas_sp.AAC.1